MRARANLNSEPVNPAKVWEEGDTPAEVVARVINRELWNTWVTSKLFVAITGDPRPVDVVHDEQLRRLADNDEGVLHFTLEWDDGRTEPFAVNCSAAAVRAAGIPNTVD